jgi:predicted PurR-regulated permease PerM
VSDRKPDPQTVSLVVLAAIGAGAALYFGKEFFQPLAIALVLRSVLHPLVDAGRKIRIPTPLSSAIILLAMIGLVAVIVSFLATPTERWISRLPETLSVAESKLRRPLAKATAFANRIEHGASTPSSGPAPAVPSQLPGILFQAFGTTTRLITTIVEILLILFLLLAAGDVFLERLVQFLRLDNDPAEARGIVCETEQAVRRYLLLAVLIYTGQGIVVALAMWMLGVPYPILWGLFTVLLEFLPYIGATVMVCLLSITAVASFDGVAHILMVPAAYLVISTIQANVVSPYVMGDRLELNPMAVLLGVLLWWCLWGITGAFVAVPILAAIKIIADRTGRLKSVGKLLGE